MRTILGLCLVTLVCSPSAFSQAIAGSGAVSGTVRDPYGDGLPDTTVVVSNSAFGIQRSIVTTDDGVFNAPGLPPGPGYSVRVAHVGYATWEAKELQVSLGQSMNYNILLQVETPSARVQPASTSSVSESVKFDLSSAVTQQEIGALPVRQRQVDSLVLLAPAVTDDASGILAFRGEPFTNALLADGMLASNTFFLQKPGIAPQVTQDAVSEMQVVSAAAPAEFGHTAGGFVNLATHTGTDSLHGAAYDYYNSHGFNAADRFAPGFSPSNRQHQFGLSAGGPVIPKLFWFFNGEVVEGQSEGLNLITNPLIGNAAGTAALPSNCAAPATPAQCTAAIGFIDAQTNRVVKRSAYSETGLVKIDYRLNQSNNFSLEGDALHRHAPHSSEDELIANNGGLLGYNGSYGEETRFAKADWTAAPAGNAVNELRGAWFHDRFSDYADPALLPSTGAVGINVAGTPIGGNPAYPLVVSEQRYQLVDNLTVTSGAHSVKLGVDYSKTEDWTAQVYNRGGTYDFSTLTAFAEDFSGNSLQHRDFTDFTQGFGPNSTIDLKTPVISAYAQDIWRPLQRLTVNLGVRWEKSLLPKPPDTSADFFETGVIPSSNTDFSPRVGLAYQLGGRTVVRAGFGSYFQPYVGQLLNALYTGNGIYQANIELNPNQTGSLVFPKTFAATTTTYPSGSPNIAFANNKFRNPYSEQATASVERTLAKGAALTVSYVLSRGQRLWTASDQNLVGAATSKTYTIDDSSGVPVSAFSTFIWTAKSATNYAHVYQIENSGESRYNALVAQFRKRMAHGLAVQASYTWSHAIDDVSGPPLIAFIPSTTQPGDFRGDQGNSSFDQRQRAVLNWTWQPTVTAGDSVAARYLLNGWQLSGVANLASGLPETPLVLVNGQQFSGTTMEYLNSLNGSGGWSRVPFESVNSLRNSAQYVLDGRLTKSLPLGDRVKGMLMFEAFNALNKQYSTSLDTIAYTATLGVLKPVTGLGSANAAGGYPYGANARRAQVAFRIVF